MWQPLLGSSFFKVEYCKSFLVCFSSGSFYIFEPIESALAQVSATGKCELATSGSHLRGLFFCSRTSHFHWKCSVVLKETVPPACSLALWCTYILCLSVSIWVRVCVYGCAEKESDWRIEHCVLAAYAQCQRMKRCVLFFFVVCAGVNKQTKAHCSFVFLVIFIV